MEFSEAITALTRVNEKLQEFGEAMEVDPSHTPKASTEFAELIHECNQALDTMSDLGDIQATKPDPEMAQQVQQLLGQINGALQMQKDPTLQARIGELFMMAFGKDFGKFKKKLKKVRHQWKYKVDQPEKKEKM